MKTTALLLLALASASAAESGVTAADVGHGVSSKAAAATTRRRRTAARAVRAGARRMHKVPEKAEEVETKIEDSAEDLPEEAPLAGEDQFLTPNEEADVSVFIEQEIEAKEEEGLADAASAVVAGIIGDEEYDDEDLLEGSMSVDWASMSMTDGSLSMDDGSMSAAGSVDVRRRRRMTEAAKRQRRRVQSKRAREMAA